MPDRMYPRPALCFPLILFFCSASAAAQERVIQSENIRVEYAEVLEVQPVYQTLTATRTEQHCDEVVVKPSEKKRKDRPSRWDRFLASVKGVFTSDDDEEQGEVKSEPIETDEGFKLNCRSVPVEREFRRPIAYDVDYVYKGTRYRSRLAEDPGDRLRIRVSIMPFSGDLAPEPPAATAADPAQ